MRGERNAAQHDHVIVASHIFKDTIENVGRILVVAGKIFAIGLGDATRRVVQAFTVGIVSGPRNQRPHCRFSFFLSWAGDRLVGQAFG